MGKLDILNTKEIKKILEIIKHQWGCDVKLDYVFLISPKNKLYIVNRDIEKIVDKKIRIDSIGMYFGELKNNELRLTIEGCQIIGPHSKKNVIEINDGLLKLWVRGHDIEVKEEGNSFVLVKHDNNFVGCGKLKDGKIINMIPKTRYIKSSD